MAKPGISLANPHFHPKPQEFCDDASHLTCRQYHTADLRIIRDAQARIAEREARHSNGNELAMYELMAGNIPVDNPHGAALLETTLKMLESIGKEAVVINHLRFKTLRETEKVVSVYISRPGSDIEEIRRELQTRHAVETSD